MAGLASIQKLIFEYPLFKYADTNRFTYDILVVGNNKDSLSFVDLCLQTGQMLEHKLKITWCSTFPDALKKTYLSSRAALPQFVDVDGSLLLSGAESYGSLFFCPIESYLDGESEISRYVFVATDNDEKNKEIAELYKEAVPTDCFIAFTYQKDIYVFTPEGSDFVRFAENDPIFSDLERMAFNVHRVWEGSGNRNIEKSRERFKEPYNHDASIKFVLSIPYKLRSIGVCEPLSDTVARDFFNKISAIDEEDGKSGGIITKLAVLEHRRWVIEKLCDGWIPYEIGFEKDKYSSCVNRGTVKYICGDIKMHPCIVRSTFSTPLSTGKFAEDKHLWDNKNEYDKELDELDLMSVQLHREMYKAAEKVRNNKSALEENINCLMKTCASNGITIMRLCNRYIFCVKNILDRSERYSSQFEIYEKDLNEALKQNDICSATIEECIVNIRKILFPVIESNEYRDYKKIDEDLIRNIPFIISGKDGLSVAITIAPFSAETNNNQHSFQEVAAATALSAEKLYYIYVLDKRTNMGLVKSRIEALKNYYTYRSHKRDLSIYVIENDNEKRKKKFEKMLFDLKSSHVLSEYVCVSFSGYENAIATITDYLKDRIDIFSASEPLFESALQNSRLILSMAEGIPYFEFDTKTRSFSNVINADYLNYLPVSSFLQVEDIFALMNARDIDFNYEEYSSTYYYFWEVYSGEATGEEFSYSAYCWTLLCNIIMQNQGGGRVLPDKPRHQRKTLIKMLKALKDRQIIKDYVLNSEQTILKDVSFRSYKDRMMFAKAGNILEVFTYFEASREGWFDDVQTGFKFEWEKGGVENELDCVLTKEYKSIIVECKSVESPSEQYYLTLDSLANRYGINCRKVLVMVTDTTDKKYGRYLSRGNQMGIITLSTYDDIKNIGKKLKEIMESI